MNVREGRFSAPSAVCLRAFAHLPTGGPTASVQRQWIYLPIRRASLPSAAPTSLDSSPPPLCATSTTFCAAEHVCHPPGSTTSSPADPSRPVSPHRKSDRASAKHTHLLATLAGFCVYTHHTPPRQRKEMNLAARASYTLSLARHRATNPHFASTSRRNLHVGVLGQSVHREGWGAARPGKRWRRDMHSSAGMCYLDN